MNRLIFLLAVPLVLAFRLLAAQALNTVYFDVNGTSSNSGVVPSIYNWTTDGSGALPAFWNLDPGGVGTGANPWINGDRAVFAAGSDVTGVHFGLDIASGTTASSALIKGGLAEIRAGVFDTGTGTLTVGTGAGSTAELQIASASALNSAGKVVLDGGSLTNTNSTGTGGSLISASKSIEITANGGTIHYDSQFVGPSPTLSYPAIIYGPTGTAGVFGTGGTTTNGGVGTLTIDNRLYDEVRFQNSGTANSTYSKLKVVHGMFRFGSVSGANFETAAGAVPLAPLADAITLDGGFLGASWAVTLNANRGITIGPNGGGFNNGGGLDEPGAGAGSIVVPGPFSGSGEFIVKGISNTNGNRQGVITLSNVNNVTTFTGGLNVQGSTLTLNESLNAAHLMGDHNFTSAPIGITPTTPCGLITIASGKFLAAGSDNTDTSYDGQISGAGSVTKLGTGTLTLNTFGGQWTNTGGVNINGGSIKFTTASAGFGDTAPVSIASGATLNMNGINDTIGSLSGAGAVDMSGGGSTAGNLTLTADDTEPFNGTLSYGSATSGGNLTVTNFQSLRGNNTIRNVTLTGGGLILDGTNTTGPVMVTAGTLYGTGSVSGTVSVSGTGVLWASAFEDGTTFPFGTGGLTMASGTTFTYVLQSNGTAGAFLLNDNGALSLGNATLTRIDLTESTVLPSGTRFTIISYSGAWDGTTFSGLANGDSVTIGANTFTIKYDDTSAGSNGGLYSKFVTLSIPSVALPGDFNGDGTVDAADYVSLRLEYSDISTDPGLTAYNTWRSHFGQTAGRGAAFDSSMQNVPEPVGLCLAAWGAVFALAQHRRRNEHGTKPLR
jgi:fibronectin-binding autotransporter adhesin